jgi:hypothetical protein
MAQCENVGVKIGIIHKNITSETTSIEYVGIWREIKSLLGTMLANLGINDKKFLNKEALRAQVVIAKTRNQPIPQEELEDLRQEIIAERNILNTLMDPGAPGTPAQINAQTLIVQALELRFETQRRVWTFHRELNQRLKVVKEIQDGLVNGLAVNFPQLPGSLMQILPKPDPVPAVNILLSASDGIVPAIGIAGNDLTEAELNLLLQNHTDDNYIMMPFNDTFCKYENLLARLSKHYLQASDQELTSARADLTNSKSTEHRFDESKDVLFSWWNKSLLKFNPYEGTADKLTQWEKITFLNTHSGHYERFSTILYPYLRKAAGEAADFQVDIIDKMMAVDDQHWLHHTRPSSSLTNLTSNSSAMEQPTRTRNVKRTYSSDSDDTEM